MKNHRILLVLTDTKQKYENNDVPQETGFEVIFKKLTTFFEFTCKIELEHKFSEVM
jgi:hypothetical protein